LSGLIFILTVIRFTFLNNYIAFKIFIMKKLLFMLSVFCYTIINGQTVFTITPGTTISDDQGWVGGGQRVITLENMDLINESRSTEVNIRFSGNTNSTISNAGPGCDNGGHYKGIEIAKTGGAKLILLECPYVFGQVIFTSGYLDLNSKVLYLNTSGEFVGESENSRAIGPTGGNVEYFGFAQSARPGSSIGVSYSGIPDTISCWVKRRYLLLTGPHIQRYVQIVSSSANIPTNSIATERISVRMNYFESELNGLDENDLVFWSSYDGVNWRNDGYTTRNTTDNYLELSNIIDFSWRFYTLGPATSPRSITSPTQQIKAIATPGKETITNKWKTWPNPADEILSIDIISTSSSQATTSIFDSNGALIRTQINHLTEGNNRLAMDLKNLAAGIYYITTSWDAGMEKRSTSFVKL
jgi:Secretion system C-terminal sorting domain